MKIILIIISMMYSFIFSGTLTGNIKYEGELPNKKLLKMDSDPICGNAHSSDMFNESFIVDDKNNLQNVLVWIKNIDYTGASPVEKKIIDQIGCIYQ
ncbi:MAG: hypothetical protein CMI58_05735, partial [Parcubacteria group bacterium]|nr:hypothetical protein [Parcubacteria group bacterium]